MSWDIVAMSLFRIGFMLVIFLLLGYSAFQLLMYSFTKRSKTTELNWSAAIALSGLLGMVGLLINEINGATISTVKFLQKEFGAQELILGAGKYLIVFLAITVLAMIITFVFNLYLIKVTTKKTLLKIISEDQVPYAFYFMISLIILSWLVAGGVGALLDAFVPYPTLPFLN